MSLLSYLELCELVEQGVINANLDQVNGSSIDLTLHHLIRTESPDGLTNHPVNLKAKQNISTREWDLNKQDSKTGEYGYILRPDEFILASSDEFFNLPDDISCEYKLKSSMARNALDHLNAGWADATWNGSRLTLELKNVSRFHKLIIETGMAIGQMVFFRHAPVPHEQSYAVRGQYNKQQSVTESKGIR
jgi:dCTP deaminase